MNVPRDHNVYVLWGMMRIFFVFNTTFCKSDEDDPKDALVYFYPFEVCDTQRYELCFQLVGVSQFIKSTFTSPSVVSLDHGKFAFYQSQNYLLVLGSNNSVDSIILKEQLLYLYRAFAFCFKDINSVLKVCGNNRLLFLQKMKETWDQLLLTSKLVGNVKHVASSVLPVTVFSQKNLTAVQSRAKQLLHVCQRNPPVIAGAVFCEELLVYSQLTPELTRNLMLLLSLQDYAVLDNAPVAYRLPPGVKMKSVYLTRKEISSILKHNHMNVGSQIRYQSCKKTSISPCDTAGLSSGSEGDVDSGNSSDGIEAQKSDTSIPSCSDSQAQAKTVNSFPCTSDVLEACTPYICISPHLNKASNRNFEKCISTDTERSYSTAYESPPGSIFDHYRRHRQYLDPTDNSFGKHTVLRRCHSFGCTSNAGSSTLLFKEKSPCYGSELCLFKTSECTRKYDMPVSRKQYFEGLSHFSRTIETERNLRTESCYLCLVKNHNLATELLHKGVEKRLQILKCRLNKRRTKNFSQTIRACRGNIGRNSQSVCNSHIIAATVPSMQCKNSSIVENFKDSNLINNSDRQEMFLYIQKYCSCTLFLLLNNSFDESLINDLWMYGFSDLGEIELESKKYMLCLNNEKRNDFQIYLLDGIQHKLSGKVPNIEDIVNDTVMQVMHIDLQSNPSLRSVSLISQNRCVVGCSVQQNEIYYMQPGTVNVSTEMPERREPFTQFYRKAQHRIKKYIGISIPEF